MQVPTPLRHPKQRIANVRCDRIQFNPGDRILVQVNYSLDKDDEKKLKKTLRKFAGADVQILIVDRTKMKITIERAKQGGLIVD